MPEEHVDTKWWWEEYPDRLALEIDALEGHGIKFERDEDAFVRGVLRLHLHPEVDGTTHHLIATFPDSYPYFPFEVAAPDLDLPHHQHARVKTLCLLPRSTRWWQPATDTLGDFIHDRLALVLQLGRADKLSALPEELQEERQAEPFSDYYSYLEDALLLVDSEWHIPPEAKSGFLQIGVLPPPPQLHPGQVLNGAVLDVQDDSRVVLVSASSQIGDRYKTHLRGRWIRFERPIPADLSAEEIFLRAYAADPKVDQLKNQAVNGGVIKVLGVLYPEERLWRGSAGQVSGSAWLFAVQFTPSPKPKGKQGQQRAYYLVRPGHSGRGDLAVRIPELAPLAKCAVAVFGLGCLGAPSAIEFARAGIKELRIVDRDYVDPATVVRWPLGFPVASQRKVQALGNFIYAHYPYTEISGATLTIGGARSPEDKPEQHILAGVLHGASLLYDATSEYGVQHFLADKAAELSIPYIGVQATPGGWGGLIVRIVPGRTEGCWICLQLALGPAEAEGDEAFRISNPPYDPQGDELQPAGCANPTFTAANFDVLEIAIAGVRTAVSTLCAGKPNSYPEMDWDVAVLSLRAEAGKLLLPRWQQFQLNRHPRCPVCAPRA